MQTTYDVDVSPSEIREAWAAIQDGQNPFSGRQRTSATVRRLPEYRSASYSEDLYRAQWADTDAPRSLTIRACFGMHAGVDAKVIGAYNEWLLKVVDAAVRRGISPRLELWIGTKGRTFSGQGAGESMTIRIPLCEPGEMIDAAAWRAYLTPGAFRSLGFVAMALAADKTPRHLTGGMGAPTNSQWNVTFEDDVLDIECPGGANSFPEEAMDIMLEQAYA
jgi:hypothetical protein